MGILQSPPSICLYVLMNGPFLGTLNFQNFLGQKVKYHLISISKIFKPNCVTVFSQMNVIKHIRLSFGRLGHAPGVGFVGTMGVEGSNFFFFRNSTRFGVCYLHEWHMQRHNFFGRCPLDRDANPKWRSSGI